MGGKDLGHGVGWGEGGGSALVGWVTSLSF